MADYAHEVQTYFRLLWKYGKLIKPNRREFGNPEPRSPSRTHSHTRSRSHSTGPIPSQKSENTIQDLALLSSIQPWMKRYVDQSDTYAIRAKIQSDPKERYIYQLIIYGEALYERCEDQILSCHVELANSPEGDIPWDRALLAAFASVHAAALRQLIDLSNYDIDKLFPYKKCFWKCLAVNSFEALVEKYKREHFKIRNLLCLGITLAGDSTSACEKEYECIVRTLSKAKPFKMTPLARETRAGMTRLLRLPQIERVYQDLFEQHFSHFPSVYARARENFLNSIYAVRLQEDFNTYGITVSPSLVVVDIPGLALTCDAPRELIEAYQCIILLHEFGHYLLRAEAQTWGQFKATVTPKTGPPALSRSSSRPTEAKIRQQFPFPERGEAGDLVESALFDTEHLSKINKKAAVVLLHLDRSTSIRAFQSSFHEQNKKAATANNPELNLQGSGRGQAFEVDFAYCAHGKPPAYYYTSD